MIWVPHMLRSHPALFRLHCPYHPPAGGQYHGLGFARLRRHRTLTQPPWPAPVAVASTAAAAASAAAAATDAASASARGGGDAEEDDEDDDADARRGGGDEGPARAAADDDDDDSREDAAAAPGRPFDSDKARSAESGRSRPSSRHAQTCREQRRRQGRQEQPMGQRKRR